MAVVDLHTLWINTASDLSDFVALTAASGLSGGSSTDVAYQVSASGRQRAIITGKSLSTYKVSCDGVSPSELAWLRAHEAVLCCFRDLYGQKLYGMYTATPWTGRVVGAWMPTELDITEVSHSEAVV